MKIIFIGSVFSSKVLLQKLIDLNAQRTGIISKRKSNFNSDFYDLNPIARANKTPSLYSKNINDLKTIEWIKGINPVIIFCFGWSNLMKSTILKIPRMGVAGFHPSLLPKNRGRHPLIWAKVLGLAESGTFFFNGLRS